MPSVTENSSMSIAGVSFPSVRTRTGTVTEAAEVSVPNATLTAAKTGTLTTRTDANTGTITGQSAHGIATGDTFDIYWTGGVQYNVTAGTVSGTSIPFDLGIGDDLPIATTSLIICKQTILDFDFDGDAFEFFAALSNVRAHLAFKEADDTAVAGVELATAGEVYENIADTADTNAFAGAVVGKIGASVGVVSTTAYVRTGVLKS
jgi:hypothetical protein